MQKEKWKWDWKFCEKGGGKKENAERKVEVRLKIQWERWKWKRKCGEKSESKKSERKVKPRGNLESHGWVETERGHSSVQRWVVDTFKIAADPTFFCLVSNKTQTFNIFTSLTSNIFLGGKRWPWRAEIGDIKLMRCGYNQYCLHCHFLEYWNTNSVSGKVLLLAKKKQRRWKLQTIMQSPFKIMAHLFGLAHVNLIWQISSSFGGKNNSGIHVGKYI